MNDQNTKAYTPLRAAIVGRPNVGKSRLFNRLIDKSLAIVHPKPGVTRDRIIGVSELCSEPFELVDTGGILGLSEDYAFADLVEAEAMLAIESADFIIFVCAVNEGLQAIDLQLAKILQKSRLPCILAVNKVDNPRREANVHEFHELGFERLCPLSAELGRGCAQLLDEIDDLIKTKSSKRRDFSDNNSTKNPATLELEDPVKIAIVGRPNVGKSSLVNAIINAPRALVSPIAGTTRDAIDIPFRPGKGAKNKRDYLLIDTAGLRKRSRVREAIEAYSVAKAKNSIRRADLCVLVLSAVEGATVQDKKIARLIEDAEKPCVVAFNKYDIFQPELSKKARMGNLRELFLHDFYFLRRAPICVISAIKSQYLNVLLSEINKVITAAQKSIPTARLNQCLQKLLAKTAPPLNSGKRLKIYYATHIMPTNSQTLVPATRIMLFINARRFLSKSYQNYLENGLRAEFSFYGLPLRFILKEKTSASRHFRSSKKNRT